MADAKVSALTALSVPALEDYTYAVDDPAGTPLSRSLALDRLGGLFLPSLCQGRLTLTTGVPVTTSDVTGATTIYFAPYNGNRVALYDGTRWRLYSFTERSLALGTLTSGLPYDVFLYDNAGTLTLELTAWTNDTTRATALTTQDGVYAKTGATTRRYVGTIRTTGTTTTEDSAVKRFVWNAQHAVRRPVLYEEATASWTYASATWRQANANAANQIAAVCGLAGQVIEIAAVGSMTTSGAYQMGIAEDATNTVASSAMERYATGVSQVVGVRASLVTYHAVGYHYWAWVESTETGSTTVYGLSADTPPRHKAGLFGTVWA